MNETLKELNIHRESHGLPSLTLEEARTRYQESLIDSDPEYLPDGYCFEFYLSDQLFIAGMWVEPEYD